MMMPMRTRETGSPVLCEHLETRRLLAGVRFNFQPPTVEPPEGYRVDMGRAFATRGNGLRYGWEADREVNAFDRDDPAAEAQGDQFDTGIVVGNQDAVWEHEVENGWYRVEVLAGDPAADPSGKYYHWDLEGQPFLDGRPKPEQEFIEGIMDVEVTDGRITLSSAGRGNRNVISYVEIYPTDAPEFRETDSFAWEGLGSTGNGPVDRIEASRIQIGDLVYVIGGITDDYTGETTRMDVYDKSTGTWSRLADHPVVTSHSSAVWDGGNFFYTLGGQFGRGGIGGSGETIVDDVWRYDIADDSWLEATNLPRPRSAGTAAWHDGYLYYTGGNDVDGLVPRGDTWRLNLETYGLWEVLPDLPRRAEHMASIVTQGDWFLFGGEHGHGTSYVQHKTSHRFDFDTLTWSRLPDLPFAFSHAEGNINLYRGEIFIAGGRANGNTRASHLISYSPFRERYSVHADMPQARFGGISWLEDDALVFHAGDFAGTSRSDGFRVRPTTA